MSSLMQSHRHTTAKSQISLDCINETSLNETNRGSTYNEHQTHMWWKANQVLVRWYQGKNEKLWIALMKNVFSALNKILNRMLEKTEPEECREGISCSGQTNMRQLQKKLIKLKQQKTCQKTEKQKESINRS